MCAEIFNLFTIYVVFYYDGIDIDVPESIAQLHNSTRWLLEADLWERNLLNLLRCEVECWSEDGTTSLENKRDDFIVMMIFSSEFDSINSIRLFPPAFAKGLLRIALCIFFLHSFCFGKLLLMLCAHLNRELQNQLIAGVDLWRLIKWNGIMESWAVKWRWSRFG